jgi:small conductance mechanosensitive channel
MTITHQIDALVTAFVASLARTGVLAIVGIAVVRYPDSQSSGGVGRHLAGDRPSSAGHAFPLRRGSHASIVPPLPNRRRGRGRGKAGKVRSLSLFMTKYPHHAFSCANFTREMLPT